MAKTKNIYIVPVRKKDRKLIISDPRAHGKGFLKYAIDFPLPEGTEVLAASSGKVVEIKVNSKIGGNTKKYLKRTNFITIEHKNGESSQYVHLKYKGSRVKVGQSVKTGQVIGYSGNTGWTTEPHLHFHVLRFINSKIGWETMKIKFKEKIRILRKF